MYCMLYRPGVHEACLTQLLRVVRRGLSAQNAAYSAPFPRTLAASLALNPNSTFYNLASTTANIYWRNIQFSVQSINGQT